MKLKLLFIFLAFAGLTTLNNCKSGIKSDQKADKAIEDVIEDADSSEIESDSTEIQ